MNDRETIQALLAPDRMAAVGDAARAAGSGPSPSIGLMREEIRPIDSRLMVNVDALEGMPRKRGEDRRKTTTGALDNIGPNRRRRWKDRRAQRANAPRQNLARPPVVSKVPFSGPIKRVRGKQNPEVASQGSGRGALPDSKQAGTSNSAGWRVLGWQALGLLSLVLAYLQYYLLDVSLEIARLPSSGVIFLS